MPRCVEISGYIPLAVCAEMRSSSYFAGGDLNSLGVVDSLDLRLYAQKFAN